MYSPVGSRAANAYRQIGVQSGVGGASPHQLIQMLFDGLLQNLNAARGALQRGELELKGRHLTHAVQILDEGLKAVLNREQGGELANHLFALYDYCVRRLTLANLHGDEALVAEVVELLEPVASSWKEIGGSEAAGG